MQSGNGGGGGGGGGDSFYQTSFGQPGGVRCCRFSRLVCMAVWGEDGDMSLAWGLVGVLTCLDFWGSLPI